MFLFIAILSISILTFGFLRAADPDSQPASHSSVFLWSGHTQTRGRGPRKTPKTNTRIYGLQTRWRGGESQGVQTATSLLSNVECLDKFFFAESQSYWLGIINEECSSQSLETTGLKRIQILELINNKKDTFLQGKK